MIGELGDDDSYGGWALRLHFYGSSGDLGAQVAISNTEGALAPGWALYNGSVITAPVGAITACVELVSMQNNGWIAWQRTASHDDVALTTGGSGNLLSSPGFEESDNWSEKPAATHPARLSIEGMPLARQTAAAMPT